ncbi:hypothetical protein thsps21_17000 [Pseudomonas sp. No.21]|uniref:hypothetical protein n=1 Tax=Pseudomonas TaxID=286 RepID=UPI000DA84C00|nr:MULTISPECIES: hypothetical protein [Pseudomonas]MDW3710705.1 hypothetical protein [Pseudomonas sp. 2023EL-01195]PZE12543.1 hypothetical protein DMX10_15455 [Pseudomonas sp. 57B-090624]GJN49150.1 hypothetical protein TUM20249_51360 [Pseudomonas tohonis]
MRVAWLLPFALLSGCSTGVQPAPELVEVKVPVPVPCKAVAPAVPAFAVDSLALDAPIDQQMKVLRAERLQRIGYERELMAALEACR